MSQFNKGLPSQQSCVDIEMAVLESMLYEIWECAKAGYEAAKAFMKSDLCRSLLNIITHSPIISPFFVPPKLRMSIPQSTVSSLSER